MPGTRLLAPATRTLLLATLLMLSAACASGEQAASSQQGADSSGSAAPGGTSRAIPPVPSPSASPSPSSGCAAAPVAMAIRIGQQPAPVCLRVGDTLTITAPPSPAQPWQPMNGSDASVIACTSQHADQGALTAVCHALSPGTAKLSTMTAPFAGDPHGPPQFMWTLTIHVQPAA